MKHKIALKIALILIILLITPLISLFESPSNNISSFSNISPLFLPQISQSQPTIESSGMDKFLKPSDNNSRIFWFIQITDTHLGNAPLTDPPETWDWSYLFFEGFFGEIKYINPKFIVNTGDLVDGYPLIPFYQDPIQWVTYRSILDKWGMNQSYYYDLAGNHDGYGDPSLSFYKTYSIQGSAHGDAQFTWNVSFDYGNYSFIALNSVEQGYIWPGGSFGDLSQSKLDWFEQELNQSQDSNLTFVFSHHPFYDIGNNHATDGKTFNDLITQYNVAAHIYGHKHRVEQYTYNDTLYLCTGALSSFPLPSYRIIALDNDGISTSLKNLGIWPAVVITSPINEKLTSRTFDLNQSTIPIRALIFNNSEINSVEFQIYNTTLEEQLPNFFINWGSEWYSMYQNSSIRNVWNGTLNTTTISDGYYYIRVQVDNQIKDTIRVYIGTNNKPKIVNGPIPNAIQIKNSIPWMIDLTQYEYDKYDNDTQLTWSVSGLQYPCLTIINKETNNLLIIPIKDATGLSILTLTLSNSRGESQSQTIFILIIDAVTTGDIYLGLWLSTIIILTVSIIAIYFRLKWLAKIKKEKILENEKKSDT